MATAQTVTALAAQNHNSTTPLADTLVGRFRKTEKSRGGNVYQNVESVREASTASVPRAAARPETSHHDSGLEKYFDAWQRHQRNGTKDWQQFQFARRIEWQPPSVVPAKNRKVAGAATAEEVQDRKNEDLAVPSLKRSYTTSALDNFGLAFINDEIAEAAALEQVNNAIAEEIQKSKEEIEDGLLLKAPSSSAASQKHVSIESDQQLAESPATSFSTTSDTEAYATELLHLAETKQYHEIPSVFQSMLRAGVQKPTPASYRALLTSAIELTHGKHQRVPKALEVYSDMLRRKVVPDTATFGTLISLLAVRASEVANMRKALEERLARYGGLEGNGEVHVWLQSVRVYDAFGRLLALNRSQDVRPSMFASLDRKSSRHRLRCTGNSLC